MKITRPSDVTPGEVLIYPMVLRRELEEEGVEAAARKRMSTRFVFIEVLRDDYRRDDPKQKWVQLTVRARVRKDDE